MAGSKVPKLAITFNFSKYAEEKITKGLWTISIPEWDKHWGSPCKSYRNYQGKEEKEVECSHREEKDTRGPQEEEEAKSSEEEEA